MNRRVIPFVKGALETIPQPLGRMLALVPYGVRPGIGPGYRATRRTIKDWAGQAALDRRAFVLRRMQQIVTHAYEGVPFYREFYGKHGFEPRHLASFEDIARIPVVTKGDLASVPLEERSAKERGAYRVNTGGSSGSTLAFYVSARQIPVEWAHMHWIWQSVGYSQRLCKLVFAGRTRHGSVVQYDGLRHHYAVNVYAGNDAISRELKSLLRSKRVSYLHGYPSAIYEFALFCRDSDTELASLLRKTLSAILFSSEFPAPAYRDVIQSVFHVPTVSWYGHSERSVLAWEAKSHHVYSPFHTYGYCEVLRQSGTRGRLVGTSYWNRASPFIRYDTGDIVDVVDEKDGLLDSFAVVEGRQGDFVEDRNGKRISLTALIFGRHHPLFDVAKFVQVSQEAPGFITVVITPLSEQARLADLQAAFDSTGVDADFEFLVTKRPYLSPSGKVLLRVPSDVLAGLRTTT